MFLEEGKYFIEICPIDQDFCIVTFNYIFNAKEITRKIAKDTLHWFLLLFQRTYAPTVVNANIGGGA